MKRILISTILALALFSSCFTDVNTQTANTQLTTGTQTEGTTTEKTNTGSTAQRGETQQESINVV